MSALPKVHPLFPVSAELSVQLDAIRPILSLRETATLSDLMAAPDPEVLTAFIEDVRAARVRALTMHTEISTLRFRDGEISEDVSSVFRETLDQPLDTDAPQIITDTGYGDLGGVAGRVAGRVKILPFQNVKIFNHAAEEDTVLLPEGSEIRLRIGERVQIRNAGYTVGTGSIALSYFKPGEFALAVEALEDGVMITGPATLSGCETLTYHRVIVNRFRPTKRMSTLDMIRCFRKPPPEKPGQDLFVRCEAYSTISDDIRFFPVRKIVTRGDAGVRVIKPQSRLTQR